MRFEWLLASAALLLSLSGCLDNEVDRPAEGIAPTTLDIDPVWADTNHVRIVSDTYAWWGETGSNEWTENLPSQAFNAVFEFCTENPGAGEPQPSSAAQRLDPEDPRFRIYPGATHFLVTMDWELTDWNGEHMFLMFRSGEDPVYHYSEPIVAGQATKVPLGTSNWQWDHSDRLDLYACTTNDDHSDHANIRLHPEYLHFYGDLDVTVDLARDPAATVPYQL